MADRYSYLPLIGVFVALIWGIAELLAGMNYRKAVTSCLAALILIICLLTARNQVRYWQDGSSLFNHALKVTSENWFAHIALGRDLRRREKFDEAIQQFLETKRLKPNYIPTYINIGITYAKQNRISEAIAYMTQAEQMNPNLADVQESLGILYVQQGDLSKAHRHLNKALEIEPKNANAHKYLGNLMVARGNLDAA